MYRIKDAKYNSLVEESIDIVFVKQQKRVDYPILCDNLADADGVVLSDHETMLGIAGRNMENYEPLVTVEEVSGEPQLFQRIQYLEEQNITLKEQNKKLQANQYDMMEAIGELYMMQDGGATV